MRTVLLISAIFLWGIWFEVADMNFMGEFNGSSNQKFIGWSGFLLLTISAGLLLRDWFKKSRVR